MIRFIAVRDKYDIFRFASIQSVHAEKYLFKMIDREAQTNSIILMENSCCYIKSEAVLRIARRLGGVWSLFFVLIIIPPGVRDFLYDLVARYRYCLFGKTHCPTVNKQWQHKILC